MKDKNITDSMKYGHWEFNKEVSEVFDEMLNRSIPDYQNLIKLICELSLNHLSDKTKSRVVDLGCGTGTSIQPIVEHGDADFYLIDNSPDMLDQAVNKFRLYDNISFEVKNIEDAPGIGYKNVDLFLSVLTLQFIPIVYRPQILAEVYNNLNEGGIFIFVEKVISDYDYANKLFNNMYYDFKHEQYYSSEEIEDKRKMLDNVLVPLSVDMNLLLLKNAGFKIIDIFWKNLNFVGFICKK